ncbi:MAG: acyl carrier protein [Nitrososphaerales archaeon]
MVDEIENRVQEVFRTKLGKGVDAYKDDFLIRPFEAFGFDSLDKLEIIMEIEDSFQIMLNEESVSECKNVGNLIKLISITKQGITREE